MKRAVKYLILSVIAASIIGKLVLIPFNQGLWWDEAVYLGLGKSLMHGAYYLNTDIPPELFSREAFRPPLFPIVIALFSDSMILSRIVVVMISAISILATYYAARQMFGKEAGLWASLFLATSFFFAFFSTKALSESLFIMLFSLSILFFSRWANGGKGRGKGIHIFLAGLMAGLAFITRYLGIVILAPYLIFLLCRIVKGRRASIPGGALMLAGFMLALIPMFIIGMAYFQNPLGPALFNYSFFGSEPVGFNLLYDVVWMLGLTFPLIIAGFLLSYKAMQKDSQRLAALLVAVSIASYLVLPHREARYLLSFYPAFAIFSGFAITRIGKILSRKKTMVLHFSLVALSLALLASSLFYVWVDRNGMSCLVQASVELKGMTNVTDSIMTVDYPHVAYLSERRAISIPREEGFFWSLANEYNPKFALVYKYEDLNPPYLKTITADCVKVKSFEQWGNEDACVIYQIRGPGTSLCFQ